MHKGLMEWLEEVVRLKKRMEADQKRYKKLTAYVLKHASTFTDEDVRMLNMGLDALEYLGLDNVEEVYTMGLELRLHGHNSGGLSGVRE